MNQQMSLERSVAAWMADEASGVPDWALDQILSSTRRTRPLPRWLALLKEPPMRTNTLVTVGSPTRRLAFALALLLLLAAAVVGIGAALLVRPSTPVDDWPGLRRGAAHDGTGVSGPVGMPLEHWTYDAGAGVKDHLAIVGDLVLAPSEDGILHAIGVSDGKQRWMFQAGTSITGPTVVGDVVVLTDGNGHLRAVDLATGKDRWSSTDLVVGASAAVSGAGAVFVGTEDGRLVSFDASSGATRWNVQLSTLGLAVHNPAYADGVVYATSDNIGLAAVDAATGRMVWTFDTGGDPTATTVVHGGIAYVGVAADAESDRGSLRAIDITTHQERWKISEPLFSPSIAGSMGVSGSSAGVVVAYDLATGTERWRFQAEGTNRPPAIVGDTVFVAADGQQRIYALDLNTGNQFWQFDVDGVNQCCLAAAKGLLFAGTMTGTVYAIGGDGTAISAQATASAVSTPASPQPSARPSAALPDPITVSARYGPAELGLDRPLRLAVGPSGDIYITDMSEQVTQIAPDGSVVRRWGGHGSGPGEFDFIPAGAGANPIGSIGVGLDGLVYVSDGDNHRIQVFSADGKFVREFGSSGSGPGQFTIPFDVNADADGNVYVLDDGLMRMTKFAPSGEVIWTIDGSSDPLLDGHGHSVAFDSSGRLVIVIDDTGKVVYLEPDGTVADSFDAPGCDVAVDPDDNVYVADCGLADVRVYGAGHTLIATSLGQGIGIPRFGSNGDVAALAADGTVLILEVRPPAAP